jgi:hypothetical protein
VLGLRLLTTVVEGKDRPFLRNWPWLWALSRVRSTVDWWRLWSLRLEGMVAVGAATGETVFEVVVLVLVLVAPGEKANAAKSW